MYIDRGLDTNGSVTGATGMATLTSVVSLQFCSSARETKVNQKAMGLAQHSLKSLGDFPLVLQVTEEHRETSASVGKVLPIFCFF